MKSTLPDRAHVIRVGRSFTHFNSLHLPLHLVPPIPRPTLMADTNTPRSSSPSGHAVRSNLAQQAVGAGKVAITLDAESSSGTDSEDSDEGDEDDGDSDDGVSDEGISDEGHGDAKDEPAKTRGERVLGAVEETMGGASKGFADSDEDKDEDSEDEDDQEDDSTSDTTGEEPRMREAIEQSIAKRQGDISQETAQDVSMDGNTLESDDEDDSDMEDEEPYVTVPLPLVSH